MKFNAACIQLNSRDNLMDNLAQAQHYISEAKSAGAELIITPENTALMVDSRVDYTNHRYTAAEHPALLSYQKQAKELDVWLVIGSMAVVVSHSNKLANRQFVIDNKGEIVTTYDKLHLFDVTLPHGEEYKESSRSVAGSSMALCTTPWGKLGLTICYDIRFPHLYRQLAKNGASFITIPSAFTKVTGEAHWQVLVRARAIETGCYIFAAAQTGVHPGDRHTYGHSLIVDPWGKILADGGREVGFIMAEIDPQMVVEIRQRIPSLQHDNPIFG